MLVSTFTPSAALRKKAPVTRPNNPQIRQTQAVRFGNAEPARDLPFPLNEWMQQAKKFANDRPAPNNKVNSLDFISGTLRSLSEKLEGIERGTLRGVPKWKRYVYEEMAKSLSNFLDIPMAAFRDSSSFVPLIANSLNYVKSGENFDQDLEAFLRAQQPVLDTIKAGMNSNPGQVSALMKAVSINLVQTALQASLSFQDGTTLRASRALQGYYTKHFAEWEAKNSDHVPDSPVPQPPAKKEPKPGVTVRKDLSADMPKLHEFATDMVIKGQKGLLPDVLLRREAIDRVIAMVRTDGDRTNVLLNAASGEGKTFLINGLAQRIADGDVPDDLKDALLFKLDLGGLVAGTKYRGEFEERAKKILDELETYLQVYPDQKVLVFIDEIQSLSELGSSSGSPGLLDFLKGSGMLERKNLTWIGATTPNDWQKSKLRMDNAFAGRFKELHLPAFSDEEKLAILAHSAEKVEENKQVIVPMEMLEKALKEAKSAYPHNALRRSVDVLNLAASLATGQPLELSTMRDKLERKEMWLKALERQRKSGTLNSRYTREYSELPQELANLKSEIDRLSRLPQDKSVVTEKFVNQAMAVLTGETLNVLSQDEIEKLYKAKEIIGRSIVGQPEALEAINQALLEIVVRLKSGNKDNRPITSMVLVGPTGVGKTESVKVIAKEFMNDKLIRLDMSDFMEKFAVSRITGAPPGYVGYEDGSALTDRVRENPQSVILFDEIEKAHPDVFNLLLQILEEGELIDNHGQKVSFKNTVIAMTSNLNQAELSQLIAEHRKRATGEDPDMEAERLDRVLREAITQRGDQKGFRPELLGRTDYVIPFNKLTKDNVSDILDILLCKMNEGDQYLKDNNLTVKISDRARTRLIELIATTPLSAADAFGLKKNPIGFLPGTPDEAPSAKDQGLQSGARDARKHFSRKIIREVYKELILNKPNLSDAVLTMDYDPASKKWKLQEEPKLKPQLPSPPPGSPPAGSGEAKPPRTIGFA